MTVMILISRDASDNSSEPGRSEKKLNDTKKNCFVLLENSYGIAPTIILIFMSLGIKY